MRVSSSFVRNFMADWCVFYMEWVVVVRDTLNMCCHQSEHISASELTLSWYIMGSVPPFLTFLPFMFVTFPVFLRRP